MQTTSEARALLIGEVGKKYVLGAPSPHTRFPAPAYDCSGLIIAWLNKIGYVIGDTTAAGLWNLTVPVAAGDEKLGDMVFLANHPGRKAPPGFSMGIGHVAVISARLSTGDREIVEARGVAAGVVRSSLSYWRTRRYFAGVRRLKRPIDFGATVPPPANSYPDKLTVDGDLGPLSADAWRWALGLERTGTAVDAKLRRAVQRWFGVDDDSQWGPVTTRAVQLWVDSPVDSQWGPDTTRQVQRWLNALLAAAQGRAEAVAPQAFAANLQGYDGKADAKKQAARIRKLGNVGFLSETNRAKRDAIRTGSWWVVPSSIGAQTVAIAFDLSVWLPRSGVVRQVSFGTRFGHGAMTIVAVHDGLTVELGAVHVRPKTVASTAGKRIDVGKAVQLPKEKLVIMGGDWALNRPDTRTLIRLSGFPDTMDRPGLQSADGIAGRGFVAVSRGVENPGSESDHLYPWVVLKKEGSDL